MTRICLTHDRLLITDAAERLSRDLYVEGVIRVTPRLSGHLSIAHITGSAFHESVLLKSALVGGQVVLEYADLQSEKPRSYLTPFSSNSYTS